MKIVSVLENKKVEKRISITPEIAKKYIAMGFQVSLSIKKLFLSCFKFWICFIDYVNSSPSSN